MQTWYMRVDLDGIEIDGKTWYPWYIFQTFPGHGWGFVIDQGYEDNYLDACVMAQWTYQKITGRK